MKLPKIYEPLTNLDGFVIWNIDYKYDIYYFYYKIKLKGNTLRLYIYMFRNDGFCGAEYLLDNPEQNTLEAREILKKYQKKANEVLEKRERIKRLFD